MNGIAWYELGVTYHALGKRRELEQVLATLGGFDPKLANRLARTTAQSA